MVEVKSGAVDEYEKRGECGAAVDDTVGARLAV